MRNLCLALVLANLGFFAWQLWVAGPAAKAPPASSPAATGRVGQDDSKQSAAQPTAAVGSISQVSAAARPSHADHAASPQPAELTAALRTAGSALPRQATAGNALPRQAIAGTRSAPGRCVSVGPFREVDAIAAIVAKLHAAGYALSQRTAAGEVVVGYWVYLAGKPLRDGLAKTLAKLRAHGVPDAYLIPGDNGEDRISLGVFNALDRAHRLQGEVHALGFDAMIADRTRMEQNLHWIDVMLPSGGSLDLDSLQTAQTARLEQLPCLSSEEGRSAAP